MYMYSPAVGPAAAGRQRPDIRPNDCRPFTEPPAKTVEKESESPSKEEEDDDEPATGSPLLVVAELMR